MELIPWNHFQDLIQYLRNDCESVLLLAILDRLLLNSMPAFHFLRSETHQNCDETALILESVLKAKKHVHTNMGPGDGAHANYFYDLFTNFRSIHSASGLIFILYLLHGAI